MDAWKIVRVSEDFRVIALGLPVPKYQGNPLDPPLRSRFQARDVYYLPFKVRIPLLPCSVLLLLLLLNKWLYHGFPVGGFLAGPAGVVARSRTERRSAAVSPGNPPLYRPSERLEERRQWSETRIRLIAFMQYTV